ncbi:MAG: YabP/YqfC family sporulation protein [Clostridia bacterium]|nr:YabP/YqfC family sporulation protein [Clostridia bacterium]
MRKDREKKRVFSSSGELPITEREKIEIVRVGRDRRIVINGIKRILQYDRSCMAFSLGKERLEIHGEELDCISYISGAIGISGKIRELCFCYEEERK